MKCISDCYVQQTAMRLTTHRTVEDLTLALDMFGSMFQRTRAGEYLYFIDADLQRKLQTRPLSQDNLQTFITYFCAASRLQLQYDNEVSAVRSIEKQLRSIKHNTLIRLRHLKLYIPASLESLPTCLIVAMNTTPGRCRITRHRRKPLTFPGKHVSTHLPRAKMWTRCQVVNRY